MRKVWAREVPFKGQVEEEKMTRGQRKGGRERKEGHVSWSPLRGHSILWRPRCAVRFSAVAVASRLTEMVLVKEWRRKPADRGWRVNRCWIRAKFDYGQLFQSVWGWRGEEKRTGKRVLGPGMEYFRMGVSRACLDADEKNARERWTVIQKKRINGNIPFLRRLGTKAERRTDWLCRKTDITSILSGGKSKGGYNCRLAHRCRWQEVR